MSPLHHSAGGTLGLYRATGRIFVVHLASHSTNTGGCFVTPSKINIMLQSNSFYCCCSGEGFFKFLFSFGFFGVFCGLFVGVTVDISVMVVVMFYL